LLAAQEKEALANEYARDLEKKAIDAYSAREKALREGEIKLATAQDEFNAECAKVRNEIKLTADAQLSLSITLDARDKVSTELQTRLTNELANAESNNKKLTDAMKKLGVK
jgi:hypothetical protein